MLTILLIGLCLISLTFIVRAWRRNLRVARDNEARIVQLVRRAPYQVI